MVCVPAISIVRLWPKRAIEVPSREEHPITQLPTNGHLNQPSALSCASSHLEFPVAESHEVNPCPFPNITNW